MDPLQIPCVKTSESNYLDVNHENSKFTPRELDESDRIINNPYFKNLFNKDNIINFKINKRCPGPKTGVEFRSL